MLRCHNLKTSLTTLSKYHPPLSISLSRFNFIHSNYTLYEGDDSFLENPTDKTKKVWSKCEKLLKEELEKGILDVDTKTVSGINTFKPLIQSRLIF